MFDRNWWTNSMPPAFLAAAVCPVVMAPFAGASWIAFSFLLVAILLGGRMHLTMLEVDTPSRLLFLTAGACVILLQPSEPIVVALMWCWLVGLGLTFWRTRVPWSYTAFIVGVVGLALTVIASAWVWWRAKGVTFGVEHLTALIGRMVSLFGLPASVDQESLWVGASATNQVFVSPEALGWPYVVMWAVAMLAWAELSKIQVSVRRLVAALMLFLGIGGLCFAVRLFAVVEGYWPSECLALTLWHLGWLVPTAVWLGIWVTRDAAPLENSGVVRSSYLLVTILAVIVMVAGVSVPYASSFRPLTILMDDGHGPWESTSVPVNTQSYGRLSLYNYTLLRQWLRVHHTVEATQPDTPLPRELDQYQVIIIKTPALDYTTEEIERLEKYVKNGGGLLLIGDHTNLFGHTQRLNAVAAPYGIEFRSDATFPWDTAPPYVHQPSRYTGGDFMLKGIGPFAVLTAASVVDRSLLGNPFVRTTGLVSEAAEYSDLNYFGPLRLSSEDRVVPLALAIAKPYGRGKVVAWGDSTMWSSFSMFHPEYPDLILRLVGYAGAPSTHALGGAFSLVAGVCLLGILWIQSRRFGGRSVLRVVLLSLPIGGLLAVGLPIQQSWPDSSSSVPAAIHTVMVDLEHSKVSLRIDSTRHANDEQKIYAAFYAWIGRLDVWPFPVKNWSALNPSRPLMLLNPSKPFTEKESKAIGTFVRSGGTLLVLDDAIQLLDTTAPEVLSQFGIQYRVNPEPESLYRPEVGIETLLDAGLVLAPLALALQAEIPAILPGTVPRVLVTTPRLSIAGGTPLAVTRGGSVLWASKSFGQGRIFVFTGSQTFNQLSFGDIWGGTEPGAQRKKLYETEYELIRELWVDGEK
ncbi:hypothetical protein AYO43_09595 [Nitrospira sp. SCGC AG-212-E16]|nr:hypothetical protein AYO43_09595 [Nitrospira sp. SCGC AG-212-E16]